MEGEAREVAGVVQEGEGIEAERMGYGGRSGEKVGTAWTCVLASKSDAELASSVGEPSTDMDGTGSVYERPS